MLRLLILLMICAGLGPSWNTKAQELDSLWRVWYDESLPDTARMQAMDYICLLYTSDAADERSSVDLGGRRIIKKKKTIA